MREAKAIEYTCGISAVIVGLGLYSYYVREILASLLLFTGAFFLLALVAAGVFFVYCAGEKVSIWVLPASRNVIARSRRLIAAYARS